MHPEDAKTPANQVISPPEALLFDMITVGYATAHPRLKALDYQPSALLLPEAAAVCLKILWKSVLKPSCENPC